MKLSNKFLNLLSNQERAELKCQDCGSIEFNPRCNECLADKAAESGENWSTHSDYETWWELPEEV